MAGKKTKPQVNDEGAAKEKKCLESEIASWWDEVMQLFKITNRLPATGAAGEVQVELLTSLETLQTAITDRAVVP